MSHSDSSGAFAQSGNHASSVQASLHKGLAALKQKDYAAAIVHLEACQASADDAVRLKAQMGLVKAYARTHQTEAATALCQPLQDHANPQVQAWAKQTLLELGQPSVAEPPSKSPELLEAFEQPGTPDLTGFTPLANREESTTTDTTGFVPLPSPTPARQPARQQGQASNKTATPKPREDREDIADSSVAAAEIAGTAEVASERAVKQRSQASPSRGSASLSPPVWRNAGRVSKWVGLGKVDASGLWALQVGSLALLVWLIKTLLQVLCSSWNEFSIRLNWVTGLRRFILPTDWTIPIVIVLVVLVLASPWLLDWLLKHTYKLQPLSLTQLESSSPEASRLLKRVSGQQRQPPPKLGLLPVAAPLIFAYGYLPLNTRIIVSQGLLKQLEADEIAALFAAELAHQRYWDLGVMSAIVLVIQLPYRVYWQVAEWGNRQHDRVLMTIAAAVSSLSYGLFWLLRLSGLWLSRVRLYYSDRLAAEITGNPNGLARALLKVAIGTSQSIQQQKHTSALLESFEMLAPVGYRNALTLGSLYGGDAALLNWDRLNPHRRWLILNNTHPLLGERLDLLMQYARHWRLETELVWRRAVDAPSPNRSRLLLQGAPFFGVPIGVAVGLFLWAVGGLAQQLRWYELAWLAGDRSVLLACGLLGFSIGMLLRINAFFPDIKRSNLQSDPVLADLLVDPDSMPVDSQPVCFTGTLLGRKGFQNWLYRDLMLQTATGTIRLHYTSSLGWIGDLFPKALRPPAIVDRAVTVTGWFRRGATPWIDVETIQIQHGRTARSYHPIWSTVLAGVAALLAVYIILRGG